MICNFSKLVFRRRLGIDFMQEMVAHLGTELRQANAARTDPALMGSASSPSVDINLTTRSAVDRIG